MPFGGSNTLNTIFKLAIRNLIRQKQKTLLLGLGIAFGTLILVMATAFVNGITDTLLNRVMVYMSGHIDLHMSENGSQFYSVHRDRYRMERLIRQHVTGIVSIQEAVSAFARGIGNGKSDNLMLVGIIPDPAFLSQFKVISGNPDQLSNGFISNPIMLSEDKARSLRITVNDPISIRLRTINGQQQAVIGTVVLIVKSSNMFLNMATYMPIKNLKQMMGYQPHETGNLQIILKSPDTAAAQANGLHAALKPGPAYIHGTLNGVPTYVVPVKRHQTNQFIPMIHSVSGAKFNRQSVWISKGISHQLGIKTGDTIAVMFRQRFRSELARLTATVTDQFHESDPVILMDENLFWEFYYPQLPAQLTVTLPKKWQPIVASEWTRLPRTQTSDEFRKKNQELGRLKLKNAVLDVRTMTETASVVLTFDSALRLITYAATTILFVIILIGIVNTLRMSIRERTREIGTMRAIGMQQRDVLHLFITEAALLAVGAALVGVALAFLAMKGLAMIPIKTATPLGIFLKDDRLVFIPRFWEVIINLGIVVTLSVIAACFPARTAAKKECTTALRHWEG